MYEKSVGHVLGLASAFLAIQVALGYYLIHIRKKREIKGEE